MGWARGSMILDELIEKIKDRVDDFDVRYELYLDIINVFEEADCDTTDECLGADKAFDKAYKEIHIDDEEDEYEELEFEEDE